MSEPEQVPQPEPQTQEPDGGVELAFPHPPEPDSELTIDEDDGQDKELVALLEDPGAEQICAVEVQKRIRMERIAMYLAMGLKPTAIAKRTGLSQPHVYNLLRNPRIAERAIFHRRQMVEKAKHRMVTTLNTALEKLPEHMALDIKVKNPKDRAFALRKKSHELDAIKFAVDCGSTFIKEDHALGKLEERLFGPKTPGGPLVQINQTTERPSVNAELVAKVLSSVPRECQRQVAANLRNERLIEAKAE